MFYQKMLNVIILDQSLGRTDIVVFCLIANHMDDNGQKSFPSTATLAFRIGVTRRAIQLAVKSLERGGYIESVQRKRQVTVYSLGPKLRPLLQEKVVRSPASI